MEYCNPNHGSQNIIYSVLYSNKWKDTCSNTAPYSHIFLIPRPFPVKPTENLCIDGFSSNGLCDLFGMIFSIKVVAKQGTECAPDRCGLGF